MSGEIQFRGKTLTLSEVTIKGEREGVAVLTGDLEVIQNVTHLLVTVELTRIIEDHLRDTGYEITSYRVPDMSEAKAIVRLYKRM